VGYGVGDARVVREVEKARGPFKVTYPAERAALAALGAGGLPWVRARAAEAVAQRDALLAGLRALGIAPSPSAANFVFAPVADAAAVAARLRARGVGARVFRGLPTVVPALAASGGEALRLAAGPDAVQGALLGALGGALR
jgi:histidinol-phosphate aminotransferase